MTSPPPRECQKLRDRLPEYADGSLVGTARARLERHLDQCPRCAAELEDLRTVLRALRSVAPDEVPDNLLPRLRRALRERAPTPAGPPLLWPRIAIPAALAVGLVAVTFALRSPKQAALRPHTDAVRGTARAPASAAPAARSTEAEPVVIAEKPESARDRFSRQAPPSEAMEHLGEQRLGPPGPRVSKGKPAAAPEPSAPFPAAELDAAAEAPKPPEPSEEIVAAPAEREDARAPAALGGGVGGGGARGASPQPVPQGPATPGGRLSGRAEVIPPPEKGAWSCDLRARGKLETAAETQQPVPPFSAEALLVYQEGRPGIALRLAAEQPAAEISLHLGPAADRRLIWRGHPSAGASIVLTSDHLGPTPAAIPVTLQSGSDSREYALFIPTLARLGETAPAAPRGSYRGETLAQALAEFTALTGLVVLAEEPLSETLHGDTTAGTPDSALQEIAARAGLQVERAGDIVFNLTRPR